MVKEVGLPMPLVLLTTVAMREGVRFQPAGSPLSVFSYRTTISGGCRTPSASLMATEA